MEDRAQTDRLALLWYYGCMKVAQSSALVAMWLTEFLCGQVEFPTQWLGQGKC